MFPGHYSNEAPVYDTDYIGEWTISNVNVQRNQGLCRIINLVLFYPAVFHYLTRSIQSQLCHYVYFFILLDNIRVTGLKCYKEEYYFTCKLAGSLK